MKPGYARVSTTDQNLSIQPARARGTAEPQPADKDGNELHALPGTALSGDLPPSITSSRTARCWP